jgi:2,3-dihydroxybiphenyl 1,2-dioxygenase
MDGHAQRFFLSQGPADDLAATGWEVADEATLDAVVARLRAAGHEVLEASAEDAAARAVVRLVRTSDPGGTRVELVFGPARGDGAFRSPLVRSGFVADEHGLGHLVVNAPEPAATAAFYQELLGFRLSDRIVCEFYGYPVDITFLHTNPRHHSLAFGGPQPKRLHHFLLEVGSLDDVGAGLDRAIGNGVRIAQMIGRHPNDRMVSFYAFTPSGFQFEYGWGGRLVDDATWEPVVQDRVSEWGHHPPERYAPRRPKREQP